MFSDNITIADAASANKTFAKTSQSGAESRRIDNASSLASPRMMIIRHQAIKQGQADADRHNVVFSKLRLDADGRPVTCSVSVVATIPRDATASGDVTDLWAFALNWLGVSGNRTSLALGES